MPHLAPLSAVLSDLEGIAIFTMKIKDTMMQPDKILYKGLLVGHCWRPSCTDLASFLCFAAFSPHVRGLDVVARAVLWSAGPLISAVSRTFLPLVLKADKKGQGHFGCMVCKIMCEKNKLQKKM